MGELRLYNVCMQVQDPEHKAHIPVEVTISSPVSTTLPVPEPLQDCLLLWYLAVQCCCCWRVIFKNL